MKQVIILRSDLNMSAGKAAAQAAHAAISAYEVANQAHIDEWKRSGVTKIVVSAENEDHLIYLYKMAVANYLPVSLIADEGRTEVIPGAITACAIGPAHNKDIDNITGYLKLYGKEEDT